MQNQLIIGLTGTLSAGKDTIADYLINKGLSHHSLSEALRQVMKKEGIPIKQPELTNFGNKLREERGHGYLVEQIKSQLSNQAVVSSIRQPGEIQALKALGGFYLIFIDAPVEERFKRLEARGRDDDPKTLEEFKKIEKIQMTGSGGGSNLQKCREMSDFRINNSGTLEELYRQIEDILTKIKNES